MERRGSLPGWQPSLHGSNTSVVAGSWTSELIFWNHKVIKGESSIPDLSRLQRQYFQDFNSLFEMGGGGKQPSEETIVDTTNVGLLNMSNTGMTYFGVGEILTVLILILVLAIIGNYCCKRRKRARMVELEQSIRNAANPGVYRSPMQVSAQPQAGQGSHF